MKDSDLKTLLGRKGRQTINLLRYSKIETDDLETKFKFLADTVEKAKLQKRKMTGGHKDARVPSKKARYGYEDLEDSLPETESDDLNDSDDTNDSNDDASSSCSEEF